MKVLFLDIDGVLVTYRSWALHGSIFVDTFDCKNKMDPYGTGFIKRLEKLGVKIVLSSTWRKTLTVKKLSKRLGINLHDKTCVYPFKGALRGNEIDIWLKNNPDITHYCIVDDDVDMLPEQMDNFVRTEYADGITHKCMKKICNILDIELTSLKTIKI